MSQPSFDDYKFYKHLEELPGRTAFIDESGNFGFDFSLEGTSKYYIVCAVIVKNDHLIQLENDMDQIRSNNGFSSSEMKSNLIAKNHKRRLKIITELLQLDFSLIILLANKQEFFDNSPLKNYRDTFIKYLHQQLYDVMYTSYPKLKIIEDEYGDSEFQNGYRQYIQSNRPEMNLFNEYDFDYVDSKHSPLVQIADVIAGSITQQLLDNSAPNALKIFQGKIRGIVNFPNTFTPFFASVSTDSRFDNTIYSIGIRSALNFIDSHKNSKDDEIRLQILFLRHLVFVVNNESINKFVSSRELITILSDLSESHISRDYLYRKIIAPLRDAEVIISSSSQGYKIPTCVDDIFSYINQTNGVVGPMLSRVEKCRNLILQQTDGALDVLDDPALSKYKRYFGDL